jgi:alkanesulfonate monooxygenase
VRHRIAADRVRLPPARSDRARRRARDPDRADQVPRRGALRGDRADLFRPADQHGHSPHEQRYYGDFLEHDERYARTDEFFTICNALWRGDAPVDFSGKYYKVEGARLATPFSAPDRATPEIYAGGNSPLAEELSVKHADCQLRVADSPEAMAPRVRAVRERGVDVGVICSLISRRTREEAVEAGYSMIERLDSGSRKVHEDFRRRSDSVAFTSTLALAREERSWRTPYLWTGAVPYLGAPSIALVGSPDDIASALLDYRRIGVTQFLFLGWPDDAEMLHFSAEILPRVRKQEASVT